MQRNKVTTLRQLSLAAIFIALEIVLTRFFSINFVVFRAGLGKLPIHLSGYLLGPVWGGLTGLVSDLLGIMVNPMGVPHPGITFASALHGVIAGLSVLLFKRRLTPAVVLLSEFLTSVLCSWLLMSYFLGGLLGKGFAAMLYTRAPGVFAEGIILMTVEILMIPLFRQVKQFLPSRTVFAWTLQSKTGKYGKISEYPYETRR